MTSNPQVRYTLDNLASRADALKANTPRSGTSVVVEGPVTVERTEHVAPKKTQWGGLTWFIVFAIIIGVLLWLFRPALVQSTDPNTGERNLNWWLVILWAIVFSLILVFLLYLTRGCHGLMGETSY